MHILISVGYFEILRPEGVIEEIVSPRNNNALIATSQALVPIDNREIKVVGSDILSGYGKQGSFIMLARKTTFQNNSLSNHDPMRRLC